MADAEDNLLADSIKDDAAHAGLNPVDQAVGREARVMLKGLTLPEDGPIPPDLAKQLRETLKAHLKRYGIGYPAVAKGIDQRSDTVISEVLRGVYKGDTDKILRKLNSWLEDDARRCEREKPIGFYETSIFLALRDAAAIAKRNAFTHRNPEMDREKPRIVLAIGPSGCGKSIGARAVRAADPNALLIRIREKAGTSSGIARLIIESAGWSCGYAGRRAIEFIIERLRNSGRLLIVDEAHRTMESGFAFYRDLADECGIPLLLVGTDRIRRRVTTTRMGIGRILDDQFSRRVCYVMDLLRGSDGAGGSKRPFFSLDEIVAIFRRDNLRLTDGGAMLLCAIACTIGVGMLGEAVVVFDMARQVARKRGGVVDEALLWLACDRALFPPEFTNDPARDPIKQQIESSLQRVREHYTAGRRVATAG